MPVPAYDPSELLRLAKQVKLMRDAQKRYAKGNRTVAMADLVAECERKVDVSVNWVLKHRQLRLFEDDQVGSGKGPYGGRQRG